jgi:hypothetical protein
VTRALLAAAVTLAVLIVAPAGATAAQRYAAPNGTLTACTEQLPCQIEEAVNNAGANDEVIVLAGDYGSQSAPRNLGAIASSQPNLDVHGEDGKPRPRIFINTTNNDESSFALTGSGSRARHLEVYQQASMGSRQAAFVIANGQASDIISHTTASQGKACVVLGDSLLTNSLCEATRPDAFGIATYTSVGPGLPNNSVLRNVTAIATGENSYGIRAYGGASAGQDQHLTVTNAIARGGPGDADVGADNPGAGTATVTIDHSNFGFESALPPGSGDRVVDGPGGGNQRFMPVSFAAPGDYHQAPNSITIDAGATDAANGPTDFDGDPRALGAATDIGADEFVPPPPTSDPGAQDPSAGGGGGGGVGSEQLLSLALAPSTFRAAARGDSVQALPSQRRRPIGTTVSFRVSAVTAVVFTVQRARPGRRVGGRCVRPTRRNRRARRCTRFVAVRGSFTVPGTTGLDRFRFTGRVGGRKLAPGKYRLVARAPANVRRASFRIVRR